MATKLLKYHEKRITNGIYTAEGQPISKANTFAYTRATASATFSRPLPRCLDTTSMSVYEIWNNDQIAKEVRPDGSYKEGTVAFVYGSGRKVFYDSGTGSEALLRARHKMAGSEYNFGETLVEFGETVGLLNSTLSRLIRGFTALRDGRLGRAADLLNHQPKKGVIERLPPSKRLAKGYLEYQFGWVPLIGDVYNAIKAFTNGLTSEGDTVSKRSGRLYKGALSSEAVEAGVEARASVRGVVKNQLVRNFNELGLLNPLLMAWNKVPFSFIADWFLPASTVLGAMTASAGLSCYDQSTLRVYGSVTPTSGGDWYRETTWNRRRVSGVMAWQPARSISLSLGQATTSIALLRALN